jgi:hypothetical protein
VTCAAEEGQRLFRAEGKDVHLGAGNVWAAGALARPIGAVGQKGTISGDRLSESNRSGEEHMCSGGLSGEDGQGRSGLL